MSEQTVTQLSDSCQEDNTQAGNKKDTDTRCTTEFNKTQATVFHNLCRGRHEITGFIFMFHSIHLLDF